MEKSFETYSCSFFHGIAGLAANEKKKALKSQEKIIFQDFIPIYLLLGHILLGNFLASIWCIFYLN